MSLLTSAATIEWFLTRFPGFLDEGMQLTFARSCLASKRLARWKSSIAAEGQPYRQPADWPAERTALPRCHRELRRALPRRWNCVTGIWDATAAWAANERSRTSMEFYSRRWRGKC